jgi:hypothetical protein
MREIDQLSEQGLQESNPRRRRADSTYATLLLIHGGMLGFRATLTLEHDRFKAVRHGLKALTMLERAADVDSTLYDAYLGPGIFNAALAKSPGLVKGMLSLIGHGVSLKKGISSLRQSAYHGQYTTELAMQYLIQFLSPYYGHLETEKRYIFETLQSRYPDNPRYLFLESDENLCFHPERFYSFTNRRALAQRIRSFTPDTYSGRRYVELLKWQYRLLDPFPEDGLSPDTSFALREYSFYPAFLRASREKRLLELDGGLTQQDRNDRLEYIRELRKRALELLDKSVMHTNLKGFYQWHVEDGLIIDN